MKRFVPYIAIIIAILAGVLIIYFSGSVTLPAATNPTATSSTPSVPKSPPVASTTPPETVSPPAVPTQPSPVVATPPKQPVITPRAATTTPVEAPAPLPPPVAVTPVPPTIGLDSSAALLRGALVNIICHAPVGAAGIHSISGSGVIIDSKGIILTNAHIAQYFLLADRGVSCVIRAGSPANDKYVAELIYISPAWLHANASVLSEANPSGNGEFDFAFIAIDKSATSAPLPSVFNPLPLALTPPPVGTSVVIASYGAQFLNTSQVLASLFPTIVLGSVKDIFTFGNNTADVIDLGGSAAAQEGSSGGGVADATGNVVGTITTSTVTGATDTRSLDAITASYIRAEYASETGSALDILLSKPTSTSISDFAPQIPTLESIITAQLP